MVRERDGKRERLIREKTKGDRVRGVEGEKRVRESTREMREREERERLIREKTKGDSERGGWRKESERDYERPERVKEGERCIRINKAV